MNTFEQIMDLIEKQVEVTAQGTIYGHDTVAGLLAVLIDDQAAEIARLKDEVETLQMESELQYQDRRLALRSPERY
jgi:hypothetical protein